MEHKKNMSNNNHILADTHVGKLLFKLSLPATTGMLVMALYNVVDTIFVGHGVGSLAIAGISIVFPIQIFVMALGQLLGIGAGSVVSRSIGENNLDKAQRVLNTTFTTTIFVSVLLMSLGLIFTKQLLGLFGASPTIYPYAKEYYQIIIFASILFITAMSSNNILRAEGQAQAAMKTMIIGAVMNIILDPIFIFVFKMGIRGAALATVIAQLIAVMYVIRFLRSGKASLRLEKLHLRIDFPILKEITVIGMSSFLRNVAGSFLMALINNTLSGYGGDLAVAAYGIVQRVLRFFVMPIFGIAQGMQPIVGYNWGARRIELVNRVMRIAIASSTLLICVGFAAVELWAHLFVAVFTSDPALIKLAAHAMRTMFLAIPFVGFQAMSTTAFQALGKAGEAMILSLSREALFLIPLILVMPRFLGLDGVWYASPIADTLAFFLTLVLTLRLMKSWKTVTLEKAIA
jgi:putative MATE family efflux protein